MLSFSAPQGAKFALASLALAAIPEEWFFRAYLLRVLGFGVAANLVTSLLFSAGHAAAFGWEIGLLVFPASWFYGWVYQRTGDWILVVLLHAVSNLLYVTFFREFLKMGWSL